MTTAIPVSGVMVRVCAFLSHIHEQLGLSIGDEVKFHVTEKKLVITKSGPTLGNCWDRYNQIAMGIFLRVSG